MRPATCMEATNVLTMTLFSIFLYTLVLIRRKIARFAHVHARTCVYVRVHTSPTVWNASLNKWWRCTLKQSMQLVHVSLSSWHNAVLVEHNLSKRATIVQLTLQLLFHRVAMFLQYLTGFLHNLCRFG